MEVESKHYNNLQNFFKLLLCLVAVLICLSSAQAQTRWQGTGGNPCFDDGSCAIGNICNEDGLCERCGESGEMACNYEPACAGAYRGWMPIQGFANGQIYRYCSYPNTADLTYLQNCGSAGFFSCADKTECWGASVAILLGGDAFCAACGMPGQRCCQVGREECLVSDLSCVSNRCVYREGRDFLTGNNSRSNNGRNSSNTDRFSGNSSPENLEGYGEGDIPGPQQFSGGQQFVDPDTGTTRTIAGCMCRSTDGRNKSCSDNGCQQPEHFSGTCYWACEDTDGNEWDIRASDSTLLEVRRK